MSDAALPEGTVPDIVAPITFSPLLDSFPVLRAVQDGQAECFRALRTNLVARHIEAGRRALAVCAVASNVGCTYIASNLAVALSQIGLKTLLIDANLRAPSVHEVLRPSETVAGLHQCLATSSHRYGEFIQDDVLPNLSVMFSGGVPNNPQELLAADGFVDLISFCLRDYEMTLIDTPPASRCSDAIRVGSIAGYSLIVARQHHTLVNDVKTLVAELESNRAKVVGTVLNEVGSGRG